MSKKIMAVALLIGWSGLPAHADTQVSQRTWQATASKDTRMEISLTHPGHQYVNSGQTLHPVILWRPISAIRNSMQPINCKLENCMASCRSQTAPAQSDLEWAAAFSNSPPDADAATPYYLSYQATAAKPDQVGEAAYELMVYWLG